MDAPITDDEREKLVTALFNRLGVLSEEQVEICLDAMERCDVAEDQVLFHAGRVTQYLYFAKKTQLVVKGIQDVNQEESPAPKKLLTRRRSSSHIGYKKMLSNESSLKGPQVTDCSIIDLPQPPPMRKRRFEHLRRSHSAPGEDLRKRARSNNYYTDHDNEEQSRESQDAYVCFGAWRDGCDSPHTQFESTLIVASPRSHVWRLSRQAFVRAMAVKVIREQPLLGQLGTPDLMALVAGAQAIEAHSGQVIVRHGQESQHLFLIDHGIVVGALRDGGISGLLDLQTEGEILWRFGRGQFFGEEQLASQAQTTCTSDAVISSDTARIFALPIKHVQAVLARYPSLQDQVRTRFISRILHSVHSLSSMHTDRVATLANKVSQLTFYPNEKRIAQAPWMVPENLLVITQGALEIRQHDPECGGVDKRVGRLETGLSVSLESFCNQGLSLVALETTCALLVPFASASSAQGCVPAEAQARLAQQRPAVALEKFTSSDAILEFAKMTPPIICLGPESKRIQCTKNVHPRTIQTDKECSRSLGENSRTGKRCTRTVQGAAAPSAGSQSLLEGFASFKKSKKQLSFLQTLAPLKIHGLDDTSKDLSQSIASSDESDSTSRCCKGSGNNNNNNNNNNSSSSNSNSISTSISTKDTSHPIQEHPWPSMHPQERSVPEQHVRFFRGTGSPKKRKSGLVLSLDCLEKLDILGKGAFGTVNLVCHRESNAVYALKQLSKVQVVAKRQQTRVCSEKIIMERFGRHPFITSLVRTFRDDHSVYLLLEAGLGGDLFDLIAKRRNQSLTMDETRFYVPQLVLALEFLHKHHVVYRDLKPENAVLCVDGYLRLTDFGMAKEIEANGGRTYTLCGTPSFLAPEVLKLGGYGCSIDWWACGVMCFEISTGSFPFQAKNVVALRKEQKEYQKAYPGNHIFARLLHQTGDRSFVDFCEQLVNPDTTRRLGSQANRIRSHPFLQNVDFDALLNHEVRPPQSVFDCVAASRVLAATKRIQPSPHAQNSATKLVTISNDARVSSTITMATGSNGQGEKGCLTPDNSACWKSILTQPQDIQTRFESHKQAQKQCAQARETSNSSSGGGGRRKDKREGMGISIIKPKLWDVIF